jgi:hypothetical protein
LRLLLHHFKFISFIIHHVTDAPFGHISIRFYVVIVSNSYHVYKFQSHHRSFMQTLPPDPQ